MTLGASKHDPVRMGWQPRQEQGGNIILETGLEVIRGGSGARTGEIVSHGTVSALAVGRRPGAPRIAMVAAETRGARRCIWCFLFCTLVAVADGSELS